MNLSSQAGSLHKKILALRLTDPDDPFFHYTLDLTEEAYLTFKIDQGLLVDFVTFPSHLVNMLQTCADEAEKSSPRFLLKIIADVQHHTILQIVETSAFRHLVHLTIPLVQANDSIIKPYLAKCLKDWKDKAGTLQTQLSANQTLLDKRERELHSLQENQDRTRTGLKLHYQEELEACERRYKEKNKEYHIRIARSEKENKELTATKHRLEATVKELKSKLESEAEQMNILRSKLSGLRDTNGQLEALHAKVTALESELQRKDKALTTTNEQKHKAEMELEKLKTIISQLESAAKVNASDIAKGNDIIRRMSAELVNTKEKLKLRSSVTIQQERLLEQKSKALEQIGGELETYRQRARETARDLELARKTLQDREGQLQECQQMLNTNETVIAWLNKQISDIGMKKNTAVDNTKEDRPPTQQWQARHRP